MQVQKSMKAQATPQTRSTVAATALALLMTTGIVGLVALVYDQVVRMLGV